MYDLHRLSEYMNIFKHSVEVFYWENEEFFSYFVIPLATRRYRSHN